MSVRGLGAFLRETREGRSLSQAEVAERAGISRSYVSKLERGDVDSIGHDVLRNLAAVLSEPMERLESLLYDRPPPRAAVPEPELAREIPVVAFVRSGRGRSERVEDYLYTGVSRARGRRLKAVIATGNCLEPDIPQGATVILDEAAIGDVRDGQIVGATLLDTEEYVLKRFFQIGQRVQLQPNIGEPILVDADRVRIEGVAIEVRRQLV